MIKFFHFILLPLFFLSSCSTTRHADKEICFLLYDIKTKNFNVVHGVKACSERLPAASTFKIPLSIMAFDTRLAQDTKTTFKWDGKKRLIEAWNKDQTPVSWMRDSTVWVSQFMTKRIGAKKLKNYLESFKFGNADVSGKIEDFWLTSPPFIDYPVKNSLKISAYEQVAFLRKLWQSELVASKKAHSITRSIMPMDTSPNGHKLFGKTGSGFMNEELSLRVGWFVGHYKNNETEFIVVTNFVDKKKQTSATFAGREAKDIAIEFLKENKIW